MKIKLIDFVLTGAVVLFFGFQNCGYGERGHANTPAETPGSQTRVGVDTIAHRGNIDQDTLTAHP